jgi:PilZ domain
MPAQQSPVSDSQPESRAECRVSERHNCGLPTACQPTSTWGSKEARWPATIEDISLGGILLILRRRFEPGAGLAIELPGHDGGEPYTVLAKVIHTRSRGDGSWVIGSRFVSELSEDELQRLLASPSPVGDPPHQTQAEPVAPSRLTQVGHPPGVSQNQSIGEMRLQIVLSSGAVINCRLRRLTVAEPWPPLPGKRLILRGAVWNGPLPSLGLQVVRCCREKNHWALRCQLLTPSSSQLLRALDRPVTQG